MPKEKNKLEEILIKRGICSDLKRARSLILSGSVLVNGEKVTSAGKKFPPESEIRILNIIPEFVSRGALKLKGAIEKFKPEIKGKVCLDLGASTGGFTEILIINNAKKIYAFDVGYGQLRERIRKNEKVIVKDRFNVRELTWKDIEDTDDLFIVTDLSFISLTSIYSAILKLKEEKPSVRIEVLSLVKPQFEIDRKYLEKGIVKSPFARFVALRKITKYVKNNAHGVILGLTTSSIRGTSGNVEYFIWWRV